FLIYSGRTEGRHQRLLSFVPRKSMRELPPLAAAPLILENGRSIDDCLREEGYDHFHTGKVREAWGRPDDSEFLQLATDRVSIFDFPLNALVPRKGEVLTAMTHFWLNSSVMPNIPHHLLGVGRVANSAVAARRLQRVRKLTMLS